MALLGTGFNPNVPSDESPVWQGASLIRDIKARLKAFADVSLYLDTGKIKNPNQYGEITKPYGVAGSVYTSSGPNDPPKWESTANAVPPGCIVLWTRSREDEVPPGYLDCDGKECDVSQYPALAAAIGFTFGGDGVSIFNLPDMEWTSPVGSGLGDAPYAAQWQRGQRRGVESVALSILNEPDHDHLSWQGIQGSPTDWYAYEDRQGEIGTPGIASISDPNSDDLANGKMYNPSSELNSPIEGVWWVAEPHNNMQPYVGVAYIIKT